MYEKTNGSVLERRCHQLEARERTESVIIYDAPKLICKMNNRDEDCSLEKIIYSDDLTVITGKHIDYNMTISITITVSISISITITIRLTLTKLYNQQRVQ